jgi:flagellar motor switch/type III secretory pathway protein FliN
MGAYSDLRMAEDAEPIAIPVLFIGAEDVPILFANQFVISFQQQEFILTAGQIAPPILLGSEEEQRQQARDISFVPVKVVARLGMTRQRMAELVAVLQDTLRKFDEQSGPGEGA